MKKYIACILIVLFTVISCKREVVPKPDNLLSKEKMAAVLYDISLINAMKGVDKKSVEATNIHFDTYIYKKHNIDSIQFSESNNYYATSPLEYDAIYALVNERFAKERSLVEAEMKKEQKRRDSLQKAKKEALKKADTLPKPKFDQIKKGR
ncbi:DUF4296 domain-containing protein [Kordia jejudonensis]|uniref:DUF4296 domain-containing protein n=1 Tax=Kordia jejudonensis TaxID=1348245 RepID=UPI000629472F|nr:DUF4296 domain-containing protein [Kordia jejudonensis]